MLPYRVHPRRAFSSCPGTLVLALRLWPMVLGMALDRVQHAVFRVMRATTVDLAHCVTTVFTTVEHSPGARSTVATRTTRSTAC